ncbi:hypothetical protein, partial [Klebsiella pneumoniae]|uniref:hypothetical protein n=1 Tax=Klebsiella pneumoniae TaxID=573 RepID=UPI001A91D41A
LMMSLWDALRMNMMISYQELVRTFPSGLSTLRAASLSPFLRCKENSQASRSLLAFLINRSAQPM